MDLDLQLLNGLSESASSISGAIRNAVDAVSALKALLKSPERRSDAEIEAAVAQVALAMENTKLNNRLLEMQVAILADAIRSANEAQAQLDRYALWETEEGNFVYKLKDAYRETEPPHFICPHCYGEGRRSILQGGGHFKFCKACKARFNFAPTPPPPASTFLYS